MGFAFSPSCQCCGCVILNDEFADLAHWTDVDGEDWTIAANAAVTTVNGAKLIADKQKSGDQFLEFHFSGDTLHQAISLWVLADEAGENGVEVRVTLGTFAGLTYTCGQLEIFDGDGSPLLTDTALSHILRRNRALTMRVAYAGRILTVELQEDGVPNRSFSITCEPQEADGSHVAIEAVDAQGGELTVHSLLWSRLESGGEACVNLDPCNDGLGARIGFLDVFWQGLFVDPFPICDVDGDILDLSPLDVLISDHDHEHGYTVEAICTGASQVSIWLDDDHEARFTYFAGPDPPNGTNTRPWVRIELLYQGAVVADKELVQVSALDLGATGERILQASKIGDQFIAGLAYGTTVASGLPTRRNTGTLRATTTAARVGDRVRVTMERADPLTGTITEVVTHRCHLWLGCAACVEVDRDALTTTEGVMYLTLPAFTWTCVGQGEDVTFPGGTFLFTFRHSCEWEFCDGEHYITLVSAAAGDEATQWTATIQITECGDELSLEERTWVSADAPNECDELSAVEMVNDADDSLVGNLEAL